MHLNLKKYLKNEQSKGAKPPQTFFWKKLKLKKKATNDKWWTTYQERNAKPFMHQGREKKNNDPEALMVNHDKNSFSSLLGYGITFSCVSIPIHNHSW